MTNSKHLPKRRFKEFELDGEWEETKLRELFQYIGNAFVGTATPYYVESGHFYLESNNIKDGQINYNTEVFINDEFYQKQKNKWLQTGDMVMVQSGHVGHAAVIPENLNNSAAHALIMFRNPSENLESHFLNYQYQTTKAKEKIKTITTGNTIQHILASDMKEYKVYISNIKEQLKIGKFFQTIDSLITLHQHKLDKLKNLKKAYLSEMFPAEGERVPKRRFPGFEGEWEQDLLGNIVDFSIKTNSFSRENLTHKSYEVKNIHYGDILVKFQSVLDLKQDNLPSIINSSVLDFRHSLLQDGDVIFADAAEDSTVGKVIEIRNIMSNNVVSGLHTIAARPRQLFAPYYLGYYLNSDTYHNQILPLMQGTKVSSISKSNLQVTEIRFPKIDEQKQIGNFFKKLDQSISLQQQKLDKLNDLKKAYLNELFV
ncbi:restriction endonuclease subunit S [Streptococcus thermophilus]|uniref:Restriction endonuclease S subunit n=2 Tax=Streptococcus thermophilus TaxID=1308 RepID=A0A2X3UYV6_STRTR|nr:restriction endonuclease subunit S [Streptococcus thermophilus]MDA3674375.1 restriction endonuclease subunit S [Streptococcus thermophilus]TDG60079.1 hypothetical protein C4K59_000946 [Streptococcus thermophilus]UEC17670.1 restriction endonuclease subunit S [Streptococcus thermophilus LMD-9]SQF25396.1 Restriction endonuclease S subunit [Streptococcus thermophilus]